MIVDVSYKSEENTRRINQLVGKPYGFLQRLKMGGIGSPRLSISDADEEISKLMNRDNNRNVCNIELRPKGIIIGFRSRLDPYVLVLPYHELEIIHSRILYRFENHSHFIIVQLRKRDKSTRKFLRKLMLQYKQQKNN